MTTEQILEQLVILLEIAIFALAIYLILRFLRSTRGGGMVRGFIILSVFLGVGLLFLINLTRLPRLEFIFNSFAETIILALVILFHPELRRGISRLGEHPLLNRLSRTGDNKVLGDVATAITRLSKERTGALVAFERDTSLDSFLEQGVRLDAKVSHSMLESIFHPGGALHDGGVVVRGQRILAAGCLFPLTENANVPKRLGTRHRAGIGLTEATDAVALVVSEETGEVSICVKGEIEIGVRPDDLEEALKKALSTAGTKPEPASVGIES